MADSDSDSDVDTGATPDIETNVLLGYATVEPEGDGFSQLGGRPTWLDNSAVPPSGTLAKCAVCAGVMSLLMQVRGDLPERFPPHERRMYLFGCRRRACRRKPGCMRALRGVRAAAATGNEGRNDVAKQTEKAEESLRPVQNLGETLFGVATSPTPAQASNPFSTSSSSREATSTTTPEVLSRTGLSQSFASIALKASPPQATAASNPQPPEPWPLDPSPFPTYHIVADNEYLYQQSETSALPTDIRPDPSEGGGPSSAADEKAAFESSLDKMFQRFADRLAENPEQVLRYEFAGQPLLYSKTDAVGKLLAPPAPESGVHTSTSRDPATRALPIPRCTLCGAARVFELQLTPHAITMLEAEDDSVEGMDWGTILVGVCGADCVAKGTRVGEVGYAEEWVGVQWEEEVDAGGKPRRRA